MQSQILTLNAERGHTIINHMSLTRVNSPSCVLSSHPGNSRSKLSICISHFSPGIIQVQSTPNISDSTLRLMCSSYFDPPPSWIQRTTFLFPSPTSRRKLLRFLWSPPPSLCICLPVWLMDRIMRPWARKLFHFDTSIWQGESICGEKTGTDWPPLLTSCFHFPTRLMSWVTAQHTDTCFTYDVKSEGRQGDIIASLS